MTTYETLADEYRAEMERVADAWRIAHPDAYRRMNDAVMMRYRTPETGGWRLRVEALVRATAAAAGFPSFAVWLNRASQTKEAA